MGCVGEWREGGKDWDYGGEECVGFGRGGGEVWDYGGEECVGLGRGRWERGQSTQGAHPHSACLRAPDDWAMRPCRRGLRIPYGMPSLRCEWPGGPETE